MKTIFIFVPVKILIFQLKDDEEAAAIEADWKFAAMVLDRLCLLAFTTFTVILSAATLIAAPHVIVV